MRRHRLELGHARHANPGAGVDWQFSEVSPAPGKPFANALRHVSCSAEVSSQAVQLGLPRHRSQTGSPSPMLHLQPELLWRHSGEENTAQLHEEAALVLQASHVRRRRGRTSPVASLASLGLGRLGRLAGASPDATEPSSLGAEPCGPGMCGRRVPTLETRGSAAASLPPMHLAATLRRQPASCGHATLACRPAYLAPEHTSPARAGGLRWAPIPCGIAARGEGGQGLRKQGAPWTPGQEGHRGGGACL